MFYNLIRTGVFVIFIIFSFSVFSQNKVLRLNGTDAYVNLGAFNKPQSIAAVDFWFSPSEDISPQSEFTGQTLLIRRGGDYSKDFGFYLAGREFQPNDWGRLVFFAVINGSNFNIATSNTNWKGGQWYHVCGQVDSSMGMQLFLNGKLQTTLPNNKYYFMQSNEPVIVGAWGNDKKHFFKGDIDEIHFWSRALSHSEITTICSNPINVSSLLGAWSFDRDVTDDFQGNFKGSLNFNGQFVDRGLCNAIPKNYVLQFDGKKDFVILGASAGNSGLRTIELEFAPSISISASSNFSAQALIARHDPAKNTDFSLFLAGAGAPVNLRGRLVFNAGINGERFQLYSNSNEWKANEWHHVSVVIHPGTGMKLYIDGLAQNSSDKNRLPINFSGEAVWLGANGTAYQDFFQGKMDEVRLWNRALTQEEILARLCMIKKPKLERGLSGYWRFEEEFGPVAADSSYTEFKQAQLYGPVFVGENVCDKDGGFVARRQNRMPMSYESEKMRLQISSGAITGSIQMVQIRDINGKLILNKPITNNAGLLMVYMPMCDNGLYFVEVSGAKGLQGRGYFIKD